MWNPDLRALGRAAGQRHRYFPRGRPDIAVEVVREDLDQVVGYISRNNLGTEDPPTPVRLAILAAIAFGETIVDEARDTGTSREVIARIIIQALVAALSAAQEAD